MADEYIRKADAVDAATQDSTENRTHSFRAGQARSANRIKALSSADVAPVVHGIWSYMGNHRSGLKVCECSNCKKRAFGSTAYCPNCGAKMDAR